MTDETNGEIELYLQGELTGETLDKFTMRLASDEKFRREVEVYRAILKNINDAGRMELKTQLKQYHREILQSEPGQRENTVHGKRRLILRATWQVAAVLVTLLAIAGGYYYIKLSSESLYQDQFVPYAIRNIRGPETNEMISLYKSHQFETYLSQYLIQKDKSLQEIFLAGNAYLAEGHTSEAIEAFREVILKNENLSPGDQRYKDDAEYFLALAYLKNNEVDNAAVLFNKIVTTPGHLYSHEISKSLLLKMRLLQLKKG